MKFKKYLAFALVFASLVGEMQLPVGASSGPSYPAMSDWSLPYTQAMMDEGLIPGSITMDRSIKENITREKFCELIVEYMRAASKDVLQTGNTPFTDTENPAVALAYKMGVVSGTSETTFSPKATATREQISAMISRAETALGGAKPFNADVSKFKDAASIENYAKPAIKQLSDTGAVSGFPDGTFKPKDTMTEEQAIKVIAVQAQKKGIVQINLPTNNQPPAGEVKFPNDPQLQGAYAALAKAGGAKTFEVGKDYVACYYMNAKSQYTSPEVMISYDGDGWLSFTGSYTPLAKDKVLAAAAGMYGEDGKKLVNEALNLSTERKDVTLSGRLFQVSKWGDGNINITWMK